MRYLLLSQLGMCEVCHQYKPVKYCEICRAWICDTCRLNPVTRLRAAIQRHF